MMIAAHRLVSLERPVSERSLMGGPSWTGEYPVAAEGLGAADGLSAGDIDPVVVVPRFVTEMIAAQEHGGSDKAPNLTIGEWLHAQPPAVQRRERLRALRKLGLVVL